MTSVVVVDRAPAFRQSVTDAIHQRFPDVSVTGCDEGEEILDVLRQQSVDILVIDAGLEGAVDPVTVLLAAAARQRNATVLIRVAEGDSVPVTNGVGLVAAPGPEAGAVEDVVLGLLTVSRERDTMLPELSLLRVLQIAALTEWFGAFAVRDGRRHGTIVIVEGEIAEAHYDGEDGEDALARMLKLAGGTIAETDPPLDVRRNIDRPTAEILEEAAEYWASDAADEEIELDDDELVDFMGLEETARQSAVALFSEAELEELTLDDTMAIPLPGGAKGGT